MSIFGYFSYLLNRNALKQQSFLPTANKKYDYALWQGYPLKASLPKTLW